MAYSKTSQGTFYVVLLTNGAVKWAAQDYNEYSALMKYFHQSLHMHLWFIALDELHLWYSLNNSSHLKHPIKKVSLGVQK